MKQLCLIVSALICLAGTGQISVGAQQPPERSGFDLAWFDEFDGHSLDTTKWRASNNSTPTNNSLQDYLPEQVSVSDGCLKILSENEASRGLPYRSGLVEGISYQKYGR
jgi:beta-glucanase (GH16 family)